MQGRGTGHYCEKWFLLKQCSFWERNNFSLKYLNLLQGLSWVLEFKHLKAHNLWDKVLFLPLFSRNFNDQLSSNVHRFVILCICWDTPSENTGLWQLPKVSSAFKIIFWVFFFCSRIPRRASDRGSHCPQIACRCTLQSLWRKSRAGIFRFNELIIFCILSLSLKNRINNNNNNNHHNSYHNAHIYMYHSVTLKALQYFVARYARLNMDYETYSFLQSTM